MLNQAHEFSRAPSRKDVSRPINAFPLFRFPKYRKIAEPSFRDGVIGPTADTASTQIGLKNAMANEVSGEGSGSKSAASAMTQRQASTVDKHKTKDGSGSRPGESGKVEQGKSMAKDTSGGDPGSRPVDSRIARRRQDPLGRRLRQMYDEVVSEEVPEDFLSFLEKADERLTSGKDDDGAGSKDPGNTSKS